MGKLNDLLERSRGRYRASFRGNDLGELASPPEIKADYDAERFTVHALPSKKLEGCGEKHARITLKLKSVNRGLSLLSEKTPSPGQLFLTLRNMSNSMQLEFPESQLLPEWEFEPSFTGDHILTLHFFSRSGTNGELFYFSGT